MIILHFLLRQRKGISFINYISKIFIYTFSHLGDTFIQSDL